MKREITVQSLSEIGNFAVVRLPGRKHPGVVVQGDSLWSLRCQAFELRATLHESEAGQKIEEEAALLCEALDRIVRHYERCLEENGLELPYTKTSA